MDAFLGIDIGGTSVKLALLSRAGDVLWTAKSPTYTRPNIDTLVLSIHQAVKELDLGEVSAVGLCVPGLMNDQRSAIALSVNVPGLIDVPFDELVRRAIGASPPIIVANDAVAAASDFRQSHALQGRTFSLAIGTGVGAAVIAEDGTSIQVEGNSPGHFGMIDVSLDEHAPIGPDGGAGSLEGYIGAGALGGHSPSSLSIDDGAMRALARAIRIGHAIYRPHHVVLLGGIGIRLKHLAADLKRVVDANLTSVARRDWKLLFGHDDFHAARGAARACISRGK